MQDLVIKVNETAANTLVKRAAAAYLPPVNRSGGGGLGPFGLEWRAGYQISVGTVSFNPPSIVISDVSLQVQLDVQLVIDLNRVLPRLCLPQVCIPTPFGDLCSPEVCINWPTRTIPTPFKHFRDHPVSVSPSFELEVMESDDLWTVAIKNPQFQRIDLSPAAQALLVVLTAAVSLILSSVPFIGPFLASAVALVMATIGLGSLLGFLDDIINPFLHRIVIPIYRHAKRITILPAQPSALPGQPPLDAVGMALQDVEAGVIKDGDGQEKLALSAVFVGP